MHSRQSIVIALRGCRCAASARRLTGAGFSGVDAVFVYRGLFGFLYGQVLTEL